MAYQTEFGQLGIVGAKAVSHTGVPYPTTVRSAVKKAIAPIWRVFTIIIMFSAINVIGSVVESAIAPVNKNVRTDNVRVIPGNAPDSPGRLCFDWHIDKVRQASGRLYYAELYIGENVYPEFRGLEHLDRTAFGGKKIGSPPAHYSTTACVHIPPDATQANRMGIRMFSRYDVPWRTWDLDGVPLWVDAYKGKDY
jgi:hypothetical protein